MHTKRPIRPQGRYALAALLGVSGLVLAGCGGGGDSSSTTPTDTTTTSTTPGTGAKNDGTSPMGRQGPMSQAPGGNNPFQATARNSPAAGATAGGAGNPAVLGPFKQDPFLVTWKKAPPPPDPFTEVQPIRIASADVEVPSTKTIEVREVADRRVSGIMSGDGVFAILEEGGESEVVKPGGTTKDGYKVISINGDSVKLERRDGNIIRTQTVQLSDAQTGPQTAGFGGQGFGGPGVGGMGGGRFGGGRFPGGGGGKGGGGGAGGAD